MSDEQKKTDAQQTWQPLDPKGLKERLHQVRALLIEAAAVGLAQDVQGLEKYADLERKIKEAQRGQKTAADIAELQDALEQCCADLAEAVAKAQKQADKQAAEQAAASGIPLVSEEGEPFPAWQPLTLASIPGLDTLISTIEPPLQIIAVLLQVIAALLQVLAAILLGLPDAFKALILAAYELLKSIINDLLNTGAYLYFDAPGIQPSQTSPQEGGFVFDPGKQFRAGQQLQPPPVLADGFTYWSNRFAASFDDPGDLKRPVVSDGAPIEAAFIVIAAPAIDELRALIYLIGKLFNITAWKNAYEKYPVGTLPDPRRARARTKPVKPDWKAVRLRDLFPPLEGLLLLPEALLGLLGALDGLNSLLRDIANAMLEKAQILLALAEVVLGIIQLLEALKATGMYVLSVSTTGGVDGLKSAFMNAANRPPGGYVAGMCLLASGPNLGVASLLWELLGVAGTFVENEANIFLSTAESKLEQAQAKYARDQVEQTGAAFAKKSAGQEFDSDAEASAVEFTERIKKSTDVAAALGRTTSEVAELAARQRALLVDELDATGRVPKDRTVRLGLAATRAARRRGARSLAMHAARTPSSIQPCNDDPPKPNPPKRKGTP